MSNCGCNSSDYVNPKPYLDRYLQKTGIRGPTGPTGPPGPSGLTSNIHTTFGFEDSFSVPAGNNILLMQGSFVVHTLSPDANIGDTIIAINVSNNRNDLKIDNETEIFMDGATNGNNYYEIYTGQTVHALKLYNGWRIINKYP
jgi:plastocyanin domain-containing protein